MFDRLRDRAERIGTDAAERAKRRIVAELGAPGVRAAEAEQGVVLTGRRLSERLWWIGGLFRWAAREDGGWVVGMARAAQVMIDEVQVLGSRGPAVPAPMGGAVVDAEARSSIAAILDRLATHGLIEP